MRGVSQSAYRATRLENTAFAVACILERKGLSTRPVVSPDAANKSAGRKLERGT